MWGGGGEADGTPHNWNLRTKRRALDSVRRFWYNMRRSVDKGRVVRVFGARTSPMANGLIPAQKNEIVEYFLLLEIDF